MSVEVIFDNIIDTGSNISCIYYSFITNENSHKIKSKDRIRITGADNDELEQLGKMEIEININERWYRINVYVIKGLECKLLLGKRH